MFEFVLAKKLFRYLEFVLKKTGKKITDNEA